MSFKPHRKTPRWFRGEQGLFKKRRPGPVRAVRTPFPLDNYLRKQVEGALATRGLSLRYYENTPALDKDTREQICTFKRNKCRLPYLVPLECDEDGSDDVENLHIICICRGAEVLGVLYYANTEVKWFCTEASKGYGSALLCALYAQCPGKSITLRGIYTAVEWYKAKGFVHPESPELYNKWVEDRRQLLETIHSIREEIDNAPTSGYATVNFIQNRESDIQKYQILLLENRDHGDEYATPMIITGEAARRQMAEWLNKFMK